MSMSLKKGLKNFKPKVRARNPVGSAQSSARPSVERQSQTPVPTTRPTEVVVIPDHDGGNNNLPQETSFDLSNPQPNSTPELPRDTNLNNSTSKRKTGTDWAPEPIQKRARVNQDGPTTQPEMLDGSVSIQERHPLPGEKLASQTQRPEIQAAEVALVSLPQRGETAEVGQPGSHASHNRETTTNQANLIDDQTARDVPIPEDENSATSQGRGTGANSRQSTVEVRQDDPSSMYPDPELSGLPFVQPTDFAGSSSIIGSAALNPDGSTLQSNNNVPTAALNPDGTPAAPSNILIPAASLNPDGTPREAAPEPKAKKKIGAKRRRKVQAAQEGDDLRPTIEMQLDGPRRNGITKRERHKKELRERKRRDRTPEGAHLEIIDRTVMTVGELCKDLKIGVKSAHHDTIQDRLRREKESVKQKIRARKQAEEAALRAREEGADLVQPPEPPEPEEPDITPEAHDIVGLRFREVDGIITVDDRSLQIDHHKREQQRNKKPVKIVVEDDYSRLVTSGTNMKREQPQTWTANATHLFYKGLSMFGTDFEMIAKMFPSRNRRQVKLKFSLEERQNKWKLDRVLMGEKVPINPAEFFEHYREKLEDPSVIQRELKEIEDSSLREEEAAKLEREEIDRQKRAEIRRNTAGREAARRALNSVDDDANAQENNRGHASGSGKASAAPKTKKTASKKKPKKNLHGVVSDPNNYTIVGHVDDHR